MATHSKAVNAGLLVIRIGVGLMFVAHGVPKLIAGQETWASLGGAMASFGVTFAPAFWGFMAAFAEAVGGLCLALGVFSRTAAFLMFFTMLVATVMKLKAGLAAEGGTLMKAVMGAAHPLELGIVFLGLLITGPGDLALWPCRRRRDKTPEAGAKNEKARQEA